MQITKTEYKPELLEKWKTDSNSSEKISEELEKYLKMYDGIFKNTLRVKNFGIYIKGLLSPLNRKSVEPIALEYVGTRGVRALQNFITDSNFDDDKIQENYQAQISQTLSSPNGMLSVDPSEFFKKGEMSAGVQRQYCGRLGKVENCQIALEMITEIVEKKTLNIKWIGCDAALGCDHEFIDSLPKSAYYFVSVPCDERVFLPNESKPTTVKTLAENTDFSWETVGFDSSKGVRNSDIKMIRANACRADEKNVPVKADGVWLYIRRYSNGDTKYFLTNAPESIPPQELHEAATLRWPIEQCFEECKSHLGMADFEGRSYNGFMRHLLFVMIAHFFSTSLRLNLKKGAFP
jgi:SRSO17 transposase